MKLSEKIGGKIAEQRKQKSLTQKQLAFDLNVSPQLISKWENGEASPSIEYLVELAKVFDLPLNYFIDEENITRNNKKKKDKKQKFSFKQFLKNLPKWIYYLVFSVVGAVFVAGVVCLTIFVFVPAANNDGYIAEVEQSIENYLEDNYFNIEVVGESDGVKTSTQNYKCVIDNSGVSYELYQEGKSPKLMVNNLHYEQGSYGYIYKNYTENLPTTVEQVLQEFTFEGDMPYSDITKNDISYIRKIGDDYIIELNPRVVRASLPGEIGGNIDFLGGICGEIKTNAGKIEQFDLKFEYKFKQYSTKHKICAKMQFINQIPTINESHINNVPWKVDAAQTEEYVLNQFYNNNITKFSPNYLFKFDDIESATKNNRAYLYKNKYAYVKNDYIYVFDIQSKDIQRFEVENQVGFFYDKYYICWSTDCVLKFNIETSEITRTTKSAEEVDYYHYYQYQNYLVFYEEYETFEYRYVIYNILTDNIAFVNIGDYVAKYPYSYTFFRDNIMYYCYLSYNSCNLYKYNILSEEKTFVTGINTDSLVAIKYISSNQDVYYSTGSKIYKLGSSFAYEYGDMYEENGKICVKTSEYVFVYQNEELLEAKSLPKQNTTNDIYSDSKLISYDDKNIYIKDKGYVYHGSYENYSSILGVYCEGELLYPKIQDAKSGQILAYGKTYDNSVGAYVEFFMVYDVTNLTKPKMVAKLNSKTSTFEFKKIKLSENLELIKIYQDFYLVQK